MKLFCPALVGGQFLPARFMHRASSGGQNISPPLLWSEVPAGTGSFVLCMTDLDEQSHEGVLWFVANIPAALREMAEGASGSRERLPLGCLELRNAYGDLAYGGPLIPRGGVQHRVRMQFWALNTEKLAAGPFMPQNARMATVERAAIETAFLDVLAARTG